MALLEFNKTKIPGKVRRITSESDGDDEDLNEIIESSEEDEDFKENQRIIRPREAKANHTKNRGTRMLKWDSGSSEEEVGLRRSSRVKAPKVYSGYFKPAVLGIDKEGSDDSSEAEVSKKKRVKTDDASVSKSDLDFEPSTEESDEELPAERSFRKSETNRRKKDDSMEIWCRVCRDGGELICCDYCPYVYHLDCLDPPLTTVPSGKWKCPECSEEPLEKVDRILTWRLKENVDSKMSKLQREYFVHYESKSYWRCEWVSESRLKKYQPILLRCFHTKYGSADPPHEIDTDDARRLRRNNDDPLEERFYQFGVRPEWLRIHRIVDHFEEHDETCSYLVKWQNLGYDSLTWEHEETLDEIPLEFEKAVEEYYEWRKIFSGSYKSQSMKHIFMPPKKPISNLRQELDEQPEFIPKGLQLHDYQLESLNWLRHSWANGVNTILADEMGLGKTIQAIVFLSSLYREGHSKGPFLISVPLSTIPNWEREFQLWAPELYVVTYVGNQDTRVSIRKTDFALNSSNMPRSLTKLKSPIKFHVLLTSYQFPVMDAACISSIPWDMIIIDEAHRLKNDQSLFFDTLKRFKTNYKLMLTGTPLQNNLEELFNLLNFLCPDKFHDIALFLTELEDITKDEQIQRLHDILGPHLLRRLKADVLKNMPPKSELIVRVELSPMQKKFSKHILSRNFEALNAKIGRQTTLANILMDLRKISNHPYLFSKACESAPEDPKTGLYELETLTNASGKLQILRKMLKVLKEQGHRVLIFSQFTIMLDLLEEFLEGLGYSYERIDGGVMGAMRQDAIDKFNAVGAEQFVFLLSTRAGGLGINLATADTVIIYDSDWNPHNDIQAYSRAHRIGQKNKVMIYRFVTRGSVEEKIAQVCKKKLMLTHLVVRPKVGDAGFSRNELEDIIRFGTEELFKEDNSPIHYSDAAIEDLLDRTKESTEARKSEWINDYLSSFKVASFDVSLEKEQDTNQASSENADPNHWKKLLRREFTREIDVSSFGKGKRQRKQIKYFGKNKNESSSDESEDSGSIASVTSTLTSLVDSDEEVISHMGPAEASGKQWKSRKSNLSSKKLKEKVTNSQAAKQLETVSTGQIDFKPMTSREIREFVNPSSHALTSSSVSLKTPNSAPNQQKSTIIIDEDAESEKPDYYQSDVGWTSSEEMSEA